MKHKQNKNPCKQQQINLEMPLQINMLNLFVEFRFQLFNRKTLFYFKLRTSAGMIENLKQERSHLSLQPLEGLRCLKMWEFLSH